MVNVKISDKFTSTLALDVDLEDCIEDSEVTVFVLLMLSYRKLYNSVGNAWARIESLSLHATTKCSHV
jgi:hypothetical protein